MHVGDTPNECERVCGHRETGTSGIPTIAEFAYLSLRLHGKVTLLIHVRTEVICGGSVQLWKQPGISASETLGSGGGG